MSTPSRPESPSDEPSPAGSAADDFDAPEAGPDEEGDGERGAGVLRTALGALRARLSPESNSQDHTDD